MLACIAWIKEKTLLVAVGLLEHIIREIRDKETRREGETLDAYFKRTWQQALARYESEMPTPPRVEAAKERSDRLLAIMGRPEQEDERN